MTTVTTLSIEQELYDFLLGRLDERLAKLTPCQMDTFRRFYPTMSPQDRRNRLNTSAMIRAIDTCDRAIRKAYETVNSAAAAESRLQAAPTKKEQ